MARIGFRVSDAEREVLAEQKEKLGITWKDAVIRGLAMGPTAVEQAGLPNPIKDAAIADMRDNEFLGDLRDAQD